MYVKLLYLVIFHMFISLEYALNKKELELLLTEIICFNWFCGEISADYVNIDGSSELGKETRL